MTTPYRPPRPRRPATGLLGGHLDAVDGLRAVAALAVLMLHSTAAIGKVDYATATSWWFSRGEIGVAVFFALSGLLLYGPWARAALVPGATAPRTRTYLRKRAFRVLPAYWALVVVALLMYIRDHADSVGMWVRMLTLTQNYTFTPWEGSGLTPKGLGQSWSLTVEVAWYVLLPPTALALTWFARRRNGSVDQRARRLLVAIAAYGALSVVYTLALYSLRQWPLLDLWVPRYFAWFAVGMAFAVVRAWDEANGGGVARKLRRTAAASWGSCWLLALLLYALAATPLTGGRTAVPTVAESLWTSLLRLLVYALVTTFLLAPAVLAGPEHLAMRAALGNRVMRFLGRISYGIFLWQFVAIYSWMELRGLKDWQGSLLLDVPAMLVVTLLLATASYYLLEEPIRRLGQPGRFRRKAPKPSAQPYQQPHAPASDALGR